MVSFKEASSNYRFICLISLSHSVLGQMAETRSRLVSPARGPGSSRGFKCGNAPAIRVMKKVAPQRRSKKNTKVNSKEFL